MDLSDTIVAVSSALPTGEQPAARVIVRLSGVGAWHAAQSVMPLQKTEAEVGWHGGRTVPVVHRTAALGAMVLFRGPRSFTGEDVAELHLPASVAVVRAVMEELLKQPGVRVAEAGEFTARAFFNQKLDLTQAEGIAATIHAGSEWELRAAANLREGNLFRWTQEAAEKVARILAMVEAGIDFSEEEGVSFIDGATLRAVLVDLVQSLQDLVAHGVRVDRVEALPTVVFVGLPNVGKSSLINALTGMERSIVSPLAGTTRDMLAVVMKTSAGPVRLIDVPGQEEGVDEMRGKMMAARKTALLEADVVIEVTAEKGGCEKSVPHGAMIYGVRNKADLMAAEEVAGGEAWQRVSAKTGLHVELLREELGRLSYQRPQLSASLPALNQRHRAVLLRCKEAVSAAMKLCDEVTFGSSPELLAVELRRALDLLGQMTGAISPDEILGRIFSTFCIGK